MKWTIANCDILDRPADVLVLSGNPQLNLSGGAGGSFHVRYGDEMQGRMHEYLASTGKRYVDHGEVIQMPPCNSPYTAVLHVVGVDAFYDSSPAIVTAAIVKSLEMASALNAETVSLTAIATGYGRMSIEDFASAVLPVVPMEFSPIRNVDICLTKQDAARELARLIPSAAVG